MRDFFSTLAIILSASSGLSASPIDFNRDVRPILAEVCFQCHGPDVSSREAELRLDIRAGLFEHREQGAPFAPRKLESSSAWQRIISSDPDKIMPPPNARHQLTEKQKQTLRDWIEAGAEWEPHWSLVTPKKRPLPTVLSVEHPIDRIVRGNLQSKGISPSTEADAATLIRRVSLDITGLPPSLELLDRYLAKAVPREPEALAVMLSDSDYEMLVDELLASPAYGEHRARYWLDAARYADTHGMHIDSHRENWVYRDWVIQAFNRNQPFDQFTIEQLAGDLLPNPTEEQLIATGFHRCNMTTSEGGSIPAEVEAVYAVDRVSTTGTIWMGLTLGCAQCHDHKFDPITMRDFYSMTAFFRNTTQLPLDGNVPAVAPVKVVPNANDRVRWAEIKQALAALRSRKRALLNEMATSGRPSPPAPLPEDGARGGETKSKIGDRFAIDEGLILHLPLKQAAESGEEIKSRDEKETLKVASAGKLESILGPGSSRAVEQKGEAIAKLAGKANFKKNEAFSVSAWINLPKDGGFLSIASRTRWIEASVDGKQPAHHAHGWQFDIMENVPVLYLYGNDAGDSITYRGFLSDPFTLKPGQWYHVAFTYDGKLDDQGIALYVNGRRALREDISGKPQLPLAGDLHVESDATLNIGYSPDGQTFQRSGLTDFRIHRRALMPDEVVALANEHESSQQAGAQESILVAEAIQTPSYRELARHELELEAEALDIRRRGTVAYVMEEKSSRPMAPILKRGQYDQPIGEVAAAVPEALPPLPDDSPRNRLSLARWLVSPANPLAARVTVNRFWQEFFGQGLVRTSEDFGITGENPDLPELLDWLAVDFQESGWDVKRLIKTIMMSQSYRQSSFADAEKLRVDPDNRLVSRGPRFRMDAEMLRDMVLTSSGLLNKTIGGRSVKPVQPNGIWEAVAMDQSNTRIYVPDEGESLHRRSIYTYWKRSAPPPNLEIFNAPTRENCVVRRERTNTPLQALATMNDPQWLEAAKHLASKLSPLAGSTGESRESSPLAPSTGESRETSPLAPSSGRGAGGEGSSASLDHLARLVLSRTWTSQERELLEQSLDTYHDHFKQHPRDASELSGITNDETQAISLAAWTMLCNQVMNLDEALNK